MTKLGKPYGIGVDIGSNSIGFAAVDENSHLIRLKGKTVIGARLFEEGKAAADRRASRTTRRRLSRIVGGSVFCVIFLNRISRLLTRISSCGKSTRKSRRRTRPVTSMRSGFLMIGRMLSFISSIQRCIICAIGF